MGHSTSQEPGGERDVDAIADRLHSAAIHLLRALRVEDSASGLTAPRLSALSVVVFGGPLRITALAAAEQVTAATMSRLVKGLEADGLVWREQDPSDGRAWLLHATDEGERVLHEGRLRRLRALREVLSGRSRAEVERLAHATPLLEALSREIIAAHGPADPDV